MSLQSGLTPTAEVSHQSNKQISVQSIACPTKPTFAGSQVGADDSVPVRSMAVGSSHTGDLS